MTQSTPPQPKIHPVQTADCLTIPSDSRGLLVGQTGSGKTYLARVLIEDKQNLVIIDPKHDFIPNQEYEVVTTAQELPRAGRKTEGKAIVYRPSIEEVSDKDAMNLIFRWIFDRGNTFTYIDEITTIIPHPAVYPLYLRAIYTQGRGRGCGILSSTQRPSGIPGFFYTESDRYWKFVLNNPDDQKRMADYMGAIVVEAPNFQSDPEGGLHAVDHSFFFYKQGQRGPAQLYILKG